MNRHRRLVDGVAAGAGYVGHGVRGAADIHFSEILAVTFQAGVNCLFGVHKRERVRDGGFPSSRFHVGFALAMTALTTGALRRFCSGSDALVMRVFIKIQPDIGVTGFADSTAHEARGGLRSLLLGLQSLRLR